MMEKILFTRPDGGVTVVTPAQGVSIETVLARSIPPDATDVTVVDSAVLPSDRTYRSAWRQSGATVNVDMPLARDIHAERIAVAQAAEIAHLKVEERKERLRDNTAQADSHAATVTALEALDLNVLATQITNAPNPTALSAIWPVDVPR